MAKRKINHVDGLGSEDLKKIHKAVRQVWSWSHPWRLVKKRCTRADGFVYCENKKCERYNMPVPKVFVDHKKAVGKVGGPEYIQKMFIPSKFLQGLCKKCHDKKTRAEKKRAEIEAV